jgi:hypothetical protein
MIKLRLIILPAPYDINLLAELLGQASARSAENAGTTTAMGSNRQSPFTFHLSLFHASQSGRVSQHIATRRAAAGLPAWPMCMITVTGIEA